MGSFSVFPNRKPGHLFRNWGAGGLRRSRDDLEQQVASGAWKTLGNWSHPTLGFFRTDHIQQISALGFCRTDHIQQISAPNTHLTYFFFSRVVVPQAQGHSSQHLIKWKIPGCLVFRLGHQHVTGFLPASYTECANPGWGGTNGFPHRDGQPGSAAGVTHSLSFTKCVQQCWTGLSQRCEAELSKAVSYL